MWIQLLSNSNNSNTHGRQEIILVIESSSYQKSANMGQKNTKHERNSSLVSSWLGVSYKQVKLCNTFLLMKVYQLSYLS